MAKNDKTEDSPKADAARTESTAAAPAATAATVTATKTAAATRTFPSRAQYLGPSMDDDSGRFVSGMIFSNGIPEEYQIRALLEPATFGRLLVPFDKVAKVKLALMDPDSTYSRLYNKVRDDYAAGKNRKGN